MAAYNQNIVDSYGEVSEATTEANTTGSGAGEAFKEGFDLVTDQIAKNKKETQADEDREHMLKKRDRDEHLAEQDFEKKNIMYQAEKQESLDLYDKGVESGLIEAVDYSKYQGERVGQWKEIARQMKLSSQIENKEKFKGRLQSLVKGEQAWPALAANSDILSISDSSPEAQKIDLAIDHWRKKSDTAPPTITKNGLDYFKIPGWDGGEDVLIPVDKVATGDPSQVYGDYEEPITIDGIRGLIGDDPTLGPLLKKGYATDVEIKGYISKKIRSKNGEIDKVKLKEVANSLALSGIDLEDHGVVDVSGPDGEPDGIIDKDDVTVDQLEEMFIGMIESDADFGEQNKPIPLSIKQKLDAAKLVETQAKTKKLKADTKAAEVELEDERIRVAEVGKRYDKYSKSQNVNDLKLLEEISDVYWDKKTKEWQIETPDGKIVGAGGTKDGQPDDAAIRSALKLPADYVIGEHDKYLS